MTRLAPFSPFALLLFMGCQPLTDPCYQLIEGAPDRCAGDIVVDPTDARAPLFDVQGTGAVTPNFVTVVQPDAQDPCSGGSILWELKRFRPEDLPLAYGEPTATGREYINEFLSPSGALIELQEGQLYEVSFAAKDRLGNATMAPTTWSAMFVAGDPDSVQLRDFYCAPAESDVD